MSTFWQTVIPAVLAALVAYQGGLTRTTRLRGMIRANVDLLGTLPADHPSRATLEAHIGELVDVLVRRQRRRFEPFTRAGVSFGANATAALFLLGGMGGLALEEIGVLPASSEPKSPLREGLRGDRPILTGELPMDPAASPQSRVAGAPRRPRPGSGGRSAPATSRARSMAPGSGSGRSPPSCRIGPSHSLDVATLRRLDG
jgi:hypothetical protein